MVSRECLIATEVMQFGRWNDCTGSSLLIEDVKEESEIGEGPSLPYIDIAK